MQNFYVYDAVEGLSRLNVDPLTVKQEEHQSWEKYLEANGYGCLDVLGDEHIGWSAGIRHVLDKPPVKPEYAYVVEIGSSCEGQLIFCRDFFSATEMMRLYAPLVLGQIIATAEESLKSRLDAEWERTERIEEAKWRQRQSRRTG